MTTYLAICNSIELNGSLDLCLLTQETVKSPFHSHNTVKSV